MVSKPTTIKNPQGNATHERMHLVLAELLRTQDMYVPLKSSVNKEINYILQSAAWAIRTSVHSVLKHSPGQLVYNRDMVIHDYKQANWELVHKRRRVQQIKNNERENRSRTNYKWKEGD